MHHQREATNRLLERIAETVDDIHDHITTRTETALPQVSQATPLWPLDRGQIVRVLVAALALLGTIGLIKGTITFPQFVEGIKQLRGSVL